MVLQLTMDLQLFSYAILFLASFLIIVVKTTISIKNRSKLPPGPTALPVIGHLHLLIPFIHQTFHKLSSIHGPLMYLRLGSNECVVASNPELAKELLKTHDLTFSARKHNAAIDHITYNNSSFAFAPYGPYWKFIKKISTVELLGFRTMAQFLPVRTKELHHFISSLVEKSKVDETVNVTEELLKLTNNVISQMMLSIRCTGDQADRIRALVREVTQIFGEFNVSDVIWFCKNLDLQGFRKRFEDINRRYDSLENIIRDREEARKIMKRDDDEDEVKDFLDMMLDVFEDDHSELQLTRNNIKALILDFLTAATDTTAIAVEWALAELMNNPEVLRKAQNEIDEVVGQSRLVQESDTPHLPYLQAIIKESFRLHPPIPMITRKSVEDCNIDGYTIPAHSLLFVNIWSIGRDPKVWEDPFKFQPERFLKSKEANNIDIKGFHYQLLPFGTGRRSCPGISLAMQELPVFLAAIIQCFDWKVAAKKTSSGGVDMTEKPGLTAPRAQDLKDFLTAATDSTAITVEWALAELINNPELLRKAQKEIDEVVGQSRLVHESDTPHLPYLQAIIKETFRLHPPVPMINRKALEDCKINGYTIPSHSMLFVNMWSIGRNPKVWKDPFKFQPERFLKSNEADNDNIDIKGFHYQLLPFGTVRRACPGISLAMQQLPVFLAALIQCVIDMTERPGLPAPRAQDLKCVPVARFTPTLFAT